MVVGLDPDTGDVLWQTPVGHHENDDLTELTGPTLVAPGTYGGVITPPATADGVVYVASVDAPVDPRPNETAYFGAELGQHDGEVVAVDASTGAIEWSATCPAIRSAGRSVVNDLVLTATLDGTLFALDRETGTSSGRSGARVASTVG